MPRKFDGINEKALKHSRLLDLIVYDPKTGLFSQKCCRRGVRLSKCLGHVEKNGYRRICIDGRRYLAHRLAWFYVYKKWPNGQLDHRDLDEDNNRIRNLREATHSGNQANRRQPRGYNAPFKGAHWNRFRGYWQSYIRADGKSHFLGRFDTPEAAHRAYVKAAKRLHGEFARAA